MDQREQDLATIDRLVSGLYGSISFTDGAAPELELLPTYFVPPGLMINYSAEEPLFLTVASFSQLVRFQIEKGGLRSFQEREQASRTDLFGNIAHRFSTYEARFDPSSPAPDVVGINSIQMIRFQNQWRVVSIAWNDETAERKIPAEYR
ncbi:MAG: hypothetical protein WBX15_09255 [Thermoanaerobaculia bacterium]